MALVLSERKDMPLAPGVIAPDDRRPGITPSTDKLEGYVPPSETDGTVTAESGEEKMTRLRKYLRDYVDLKTDEIEERREALRYYHDQQWTDEELERLRERGQPPITYNRIKRKINGVVGLLERLRQDPKAYPRTPAHIQGADVATQALRYALDACEWESSLSETVFDLATAGIGGYQLGLEPAEDGSQDPLQERVAPETFFYDPRSVKADFSDARYMGVAKWMAKDEVIAFLPDKAKDIEESYSELSTGDSTYAEALDPDKEPLWWDGELKKVRVVEVWFREGNRWLYAIYTGTTILAEGDSPFIDAKNRPTHGFSMQSANVDHKGNRYGFVRTLKGAQDEVNHRRSKALHAFNTKQVIVEDGLVSDIEVIRREAQRVDGVLALPNGQKGKLTISSNTDTALANVQLLQEAKEEIEGFGPNPALIGQGLDNKSGRAIALLQQAAIAELGPFIVRVRAMKLRCYALTWEAIRQFWTSARYIRLTDDEGLAGFLAVNQPRTDPYGNVVGTENPIGKVLVDFVLDEGPDTVTLREDAQQALGQAMQSTAQAVPPEVLKAMSRALIETMNLPPASQKRILAAFDQAEQPDPAAPLKMQGAISEVRKNNANAAESEASAAVKVQEAREKTMQNSMNELAARIAVTGNASLV